MALVSLSTLRTRAKSLCDKAGDAFVSDSEWTAFLNEGLAELHGLLARVQEGYRETSATLATDGTEDVSLPAGFLRLTGVDVQVSGRWYEARPFDWSERNALRGVTSPTGASTRYCVRGSRLVLLPVPPSGLSVRLNYVPVYTPLAGESDEADCGNGWERYVCIQAAISALQKGEEDATHLERERARLEARIRSEAGGRDSANPPRVRDVSRECDDEEAPWRFP